MRNLISLCRVPLCTVFLTNAMVLGQEKPYSLEVGDHAVSISVEDDMGIPLEEFIRIAERVTGKVFTYSAQAVEDSRVQFVGKVHLEPERFFEFFQTMLYVKGFACVLRGEGDSEVVEVVSMQGGHTRESRQSPKKAPRYVTPAKLSEYADRDDVSILVTVPLEHLDVTRAREALSPLGRVREMGLRFGHLGGSKELLLQGPASQVYMASRLIELIDVPQPPESDIRVFRLEHAGAEQIGEFLSELLAERRPEIRIVSHGDDTLLVSGDQETVATVLDVISRLDR